MRLVKLAFFIIIVTNNNYLFSQECENKIYCKIDSILKSIDSSYRNNPKNEVIIVFTVSFSTDSLGVIESFIKVDGIQLDLYVFREACMNINFKCLDSFIGFDSVILPFKRSYVCQICNK